MHESCGWCDFLCFEPATAFSQTHACTECLVTWCARIHSTTPVVQHRPYKIETFKLKLNYLIFLVNTIFDTSIFVRYRSGIFTRQFTIIFIFMKIVNSIEATLPPARHLCDTPELTVNFRIWHVLAECMQIFYSIVLPSVLGIANHVMCQMTSANVFLCKHIQKTSEYGCNYMYLFTCVLAPQKRQKSGVNKITFPTEIQVINARWIDYWFVDGQEKRHETHAPNQLNRPMMISLGRWQHKARRDNGDWHRVINNKHNSKNRIKRQIVNLTCSVHCVCDFGINKKKTKHRS